MTRTADIVIIGAGIAGVSAAYHLSVRHDVGEVILVDPRPSLTLTSDKSTECYRNWWPDEAMTGLMNRSIDIYDELAGETDFGLNRNGYLFVTAEPMTLSDMARQLGEAARYGTEAELMNAEGVRSRYGYLTEEAVGAVRVVRAGWFRAWDLGMWMLDRALASGASVLPSTVISIDGDVVGLSDGTTISSPVVVVAAGPMAGDVAAMAGVDLPLFSELHLKVTFKDHRGVVPRDAPMTIWCDTQTIDWTEEERSELASMGRQDVLGEMPVYCHFRPGGGIDSPYHVALWEYHGKVVEPVWPLPEDPLYPEVVMRGLSTMVPGLAAYRDELPESFVDGGYYTKTRENRPLIGPTNADGVHVLAGLSGFGVMAAAGAADLLAAHITQTDLPEYSGAFLLSRYQDPDYLAAIDSVSQGQL